MLRPRRAFATTALSLTVLGAALAAAAAAQTGMTAPSLLWDASFTVEGTLRGPAAVALGRARVVVTGTVGGDERGDGTDVLTVGLARASGAETWRRIFDSGRTDTVKTLLSTPTTVYVIGNATEYEVGRFHSESFVQALRTRDGAARWQSLSSTARGNFGESLLAADAGADALVVAGTLEGAILVRALRPRNGRVLWQDAAPSGYISERVTAVHVSGNRVYVAGDRDTALGRSAPYVVRAYDMATGERLWESVFGQQVNNARALHMVDGVLVVTGSYWDIGPGVRHMELWGLDPATGQVAWSRRPAGRSFNGSQASGLLPAGPGVVVAGAVSRARTLPVIRAYGSDGAPAWRANSDPLRTGSVGAVAGGDGLMVAAGTASTAAVAGSSYWVRGIDPASGAVLWDEVRALGSGDSAAGALAWSADRLAVAGHHLGPAGAPRWVVRVYRLP